MNKSKLTSEIADRIVLLVRAGNYLNTAAAAAGVHRNTLEAWLRKGDAEPNSIYGKLAADVHAAQSECEGRLVGIILKASSRDWRAATWMLERRYGEQWRPEKVKESLPPIVEPLAPPERSSNRAPVKLFEVKSR